MEQRRQPLVPIWVVTVLLAVASFTGGLYTRGAVVQADVDMIKHQITQLEEANRERVPRAEIAPQLEALTREIYELRKEVHELRGTRR